jgi:hypothetical protein
MSRGTPFANVLLVASTAPAQAATTCHPEPQAKDLVADSETRCLRRDLSLRSG